MSPGSSAIRARPRSSADEVLLVGRAGGQRDVEVRALAVPFPGLVLPAEDVRVLPVGVRVEAHVQDVATPPEDLLGAVAVVVVEVEDRDVGAGLAGDRLGGDRGVVEVAEPAVHRARGVMPGRPAQPVGRALAAEDEVSGRQGDVDRGPRGRVRALDDVRGRVERPVAGPPVRSRRLGARTARPSPRSRRGSGSSRARGSRTGCPARTASSHARLEEPQQARVMDRGDRLGAVRRWARAPRTRHRRGASCG